MCRAATRKVTNWPMKAATTYERCVLCVLEANGTFAHGDLPEQIERNCRTVADTTRRTLSPSFLPCHSGESSISKGRTLSS